MKKGAKKLGLRLLGINATWEMSQSPPLFPRRGDPPVVASPLFRRSKMAGATATFSRDICRGKRAPERQLFLPPNIARYKLPGSRVIFGRVRQLEAQKYP